MRQVRRSVSRRPDATEALVLLRARGVSLATVESLTGGRLAAAVTAVPGASASYLGGFVTYATELKESLVGVPHEVVERYGVVSAECAAAMAQGCRETTGAGYAVATTGVAGPDAQEGRPVGTVFVGIAAAAGVRTLSLELVGDRHQIQDRACREALSALCETLRGNPGEEQPTLG